MCQRQMPHLQHQIVRFTKETRKRSLPDNVQLNFFNFNLTAVRALTKVTIFYCELGIAVYFCERIGKAV